MIDTVPAAVGISIHALREEGDLMRSSPPRSLKFLSTPSARRATSICPAGVDA